MLVTHSISEAVLLSDRILVLSPRPAAIIADIAVPMARPRRGEMIGSDMFRALERAVAEVLFDGQVAA